MRRFCLVGLVLTAACSDALEQTSSAGQVLGFVNVNAPVLELISPGGSAATAVPLENPGSIGRSSIAGRGSLFVVALGAALGTHVTSVVNIVSLDSRSGVVTDTLVFNDEIVGVVIQDDSIVWLSSENPPEVLRVNYLARVATRTALSGTPAGLVITSGKVFIVNAGQGPGPSWISVVDIGTRVVTDSVPLTGRGAYSVILGGDSLLYAIAGADGKVSIVDPMALRELVVINGLGLGYAKAAVFHPSGRLLIPSIADGILEVNTLTRALTLGPEDAVKPGGHSVETLALDNGGTIYAATCGIVQVLTGPPEYRDVRAVDVAGCPVAAATAVRR